MQDIKRLHSDLQWLINSPDFLSVTQINSLYDKELCNASELLDTVVVNSDTFTFESTHRLGVYFEQLWHHLIRSTPMLRLLRYNQQVIIHKHTVGEFDSIIQQVTLDQALHCELAVKFYLQIGDGNLMADWVGPNLRDRFDRKFLRLLNHQLTLSTQPEVQQWLQQEELVIKQVGLFTRGRLFYSLNNFLERRFQYPKEVECDHFKGFWMTHQEFENYQRHTDWGWYQLPKMYWLSELKPGDYSHVHKVNHLNEGQLVKLVAVKNEQEIMRGFVVSDEWLEKAKVRVLTQE